jgi:serine/threonine protein kinase/WD40 repeat protein
MTALSVHDVVQVLADQALLLPSQLAELKRVSPRGNANALVQALIERGWLTAYQASRLLQGQAAQLRFGPYVILEPLGEGGMGHIFKGRHHGLDRLAAIKVLRHDLVTDAELVQRFLREIKLASQLPKHPHLVHALDAGTVAGTYYLAMEYIEGIDLDRLIEQGGPLPVPQACDYIRQAALGLQHAHEHGLVHRDIKPANLLVTPRPGKTPTAGGTIKILDLGLARLHGKGTQAGQTILTLTSDGTMTMGTADYMAPEQALDLHRADIRADIYSLGCTLYYLLTGRPPFGGGPLAVKLMRHQQAEPPDLKERRPDVPDGLIPIVRRMLAKKPEDRYQTPAEVAAALAALFSQRQASPPTRPAFPRSGVLGTILGFVARQVGRHPRLALGAMAGLLILAIVLWPGSSREQLAGPTDAPPGPSAFEQLARSSPLDLLDPARIKALPPERRPPETVAVMTGHRLAEHYVKFSPDARFLAVCGDPTHRELALYDLAGPQPTLYALEGHTAGLYLATFSPDSKLVISASTDQTSRRWSLAGLPPQFLGQSMCSTLQGAAFSPDGTMLANATQTLYVWNMVDGQMQLRAQLANVTAPLAWTAPGKLLGCVAPRRSAIRFLDLTGKEPTDIAVLPVEGSLTTLAYAPGVNQVATGDSATAVKLWDLNQRPPVPRTLATASQPQAWTTGISALAIRRDGKAAAAGTNYGYMRLWDLRGPEARQRVQVPPGKDGQRIAQLVFTPNGKLLLSVSGAWLRLWDVASGQKLREWDFGGIHTMDLAPDGRHVAVGAHGNYLYILRLPPVPEPAR